MAKLKVAILGSGNIGTDLLVKSLRSSYIDPVIFIGRTISSAGMQKAKELGVAVSDQGIKYIIENPDCCDLVFDATSAAGHFEHAKVLDRLGKIAIDLTPSKIGIMCVPSINRDECLMATNVNMVTCGGQAAIPLAYAIKQSQKVIDYIEVVSSAASRSAGPGTRSNLDEYIHTTENGVKYFSGALKTKAILTLNPAVPCVNMQTTLLVKIKNLDMDALIESVKLMEHKVHDYVPGYEILVGPVLENSRVVITVSVRGHGDYLPAYAGNLDIMNCAAIEIAECFAIKLAKGI